MIADKLVNLIKIGNLTEALDLLIVIVKVHDTDMYKNLLLLYSRLRGVNEQLNMGLIKYEEYKQERNIIAKSLLDWFSQISSSDFFKNLDLDEIEKINSKSSVEETKILFVATNPKGTPKFQLEKEYLGIRQIFKRKRHLFTLTELFNPTLDMLFEEIRIEKPNILHISGTSTDKYLLLHRPDDKIRSVPYDILCSAFTLFQPFVKCVFINSWCSTIFLKKVSASLNFAIGSKKLVPDDHAILFSTGFYVAISEGQSFEEAYSLGIRNTEKENDFPNLSFKRVNSYEKENDSPFVMFSGGKSNHKYDNTPEDFSFKEPTEILNFLGLGSDYDISD